LKTRSKRGDIAPTAHKQALTEEVVEKLYDGGELVEFDTPNPGKLQQTAWFFINLFLGKRGRENQHTMKKTVLALKKKDTSWRRILRSEQRARSCVGNKEPSRWS